MKKVFFVLMMFFVFVGNAQNFNGYAVYQSKTSTEDFKLGDNPQITPEMQKMIMDRMKKMSEKTFELHFNKDASIYEEQVVLEAGNDPFGEGFKMMSNAMYGGVYYKDLKQNQFRQVRDIFGKEFLIKDSLTVYNWELGTETKQIGNYTCFKATAKIAVDLSDFKNLRRKDQTESKEEQSTNFLDQIEIPNEVIVTAWYTPEIPVSNGPGEFWGLPGLIMEVSSGKTTLLCSKIVINPKEKKEIKAPKNGKEVTQKEFQKEFLEKMEELQKMGRGGNRGPRMGRF